MTDPHAPGDSVARLYDRWSAHLGAYGIVERLSRPLRRDAVAALDLAPGDRVLDVGCGPGVNFELLREAVGPGGEVVGVDLSPGMVAAARDRARRNDWGNVSVVRGDVTALGVVDGSVDSALATLVLSTVPDGVAASARVRDALVPGGRLAVLDGRLPREGAVGVLRSVLAPLYRRVAAFRPDADPLAALRESFPAVEVVETYDAGLSFLAVAGVADAERSTGADGGSTARASGG